MRIPTPVLFPLAVAVALPPSPPLALTKGIATVAAESASGDGTDLERVAAGGIADATGSCRRVAAVATFAAINWNRIAAESTKRRAHGRKTGITRAGRRCQAGGIAACARDSRQSGRAHAERKATVP